MHETSISGSNLPRHPSTMTLTDLFGAQASAARVAPADGKHPVTNLGLDGVSTSRTKSTEDLSTQSRAQPSGRRALPAAVRVSGLSTWTGRVVEVDEDLFTVELVPDRNTAGGAVLADFNRSLVVDESEPLEVGDVVYVTTRTVRAPHGGRSETSSIRLRRLGHWTSEDVERLSAKAESLASAFADLVES